MQELCPTRAAIGLRQDKDKLSRAPGSPHGSGSARAGQNPARGFQGLKNMLLLVVVVCFFFFHMANRELKRPADPCLSSLVAQAAGQTCAQISAQMPEQDSKK